MKKIIYLLSFVTVFLSCTESDKTIDFVYENIQKGAIIRTISSSGEYNFYDPANSIFSATIEEHDAENGGLMQNIEVYVSLNGGSEALLKTLQPGEFTTGPTGLPRTDLKVSLAESANALGLSSSDYTGGDAINIRLKLNLTDGRSFSSGDVTGSMTGSYFASPFAYNMVIKCIPLSAVPGIYTFTMSDSYGDGWQGSHIKVTVDGTTTYYGIPSPYGGDAERNALLEPFTGNESGGTAQLIIPEGASSMSFAWNSGDWPSECSYTITYTKLDGTGEQTAFSEGSVSPGTKVLSICQ
ncbi:MAG: hypothetical protein ACO39G_00320 [Flavobacteriaceae bacterium]